MPTVSYWGGLYFLWRLLINPNLYSINFILHLQALLPFQGQCRYADRCGLLR